MATLTALFEDLAAHHEQIAARLRAYVEDTQTEDLSGSSSVDRAIAAANGMHPSRQLGQRQLEALRLIAEAHPHGTTTGELGKAMGYGQTNVYLTLRRLMEFDVVRRDTDANPHRYYISDEVVKGIGDA